MSLISLCVINDIKKCDINFYTKQLETLAKSHKRGVKFSIDWPEPLVLQLKNDSFIVNIVDCPKCDNCELFLLPDGWYSNGKTNDLAFRERMKLLREIANIFINRNYSVELYLGESGTPPEDFYDIILNNNELVDYLSSTIGIEGIDGGVHISILPG